jgi:hypothetical protein
LSWGFLKLLADLRKKSFFDRFLRFLIRLIVLGANLRGHITETKEMALMTKDASDSQGLKKPQKKPNFPIMSNGRNTKKMRF